jgi:hypothetical protein
MGLVMCISLWKSFIYPGVGIARRHHVGPLVLQRVVKEVIRKAGITEAVSAHTVWHLFATHQREAGDDIYIPSKRGRAIEMPAPH